MLIPCRELTSITNLQLDVELLKAESRKSIVQTSPKELISCSWLEMGTKELLCFGPYVFSNLEHIYNQIFVFRNFLSI